MLCHSASKGDPHSMSTSMEWIPPATGEFFVHKLLHSQALCRFCYLSARKRYVFVVLIHLDSPGLLMGFHVHKLHTFLCRPCNQRPTPSYAADRSLTQVERSMFCFLEKQRSISSWQKLPLFVCGKTPHLL